MIQVVELGGLETHKGVSVLGTTTTLSSLSRVIDARASNVVITTTIVLWTKTLKDAPMLFKATTSIVGEVHENFDLLCLHASLDIGDDLSDLVTILWTWLWLGTVKQYDKQRTDLQFITCGRSISKLERKRVSQPALDHNHTKLGTQMGRS